MTKTNNMDKVYTSVPYKVIKGNMNISIFENNNRQLADSSMTTNRNRSNSKDNKKSTGKVTIKKEIQDAGFE